MEVWHTRGVRKIVQLAYKKNANNMNCGLFFNMAVFKGVYGLKPPKCWGKCYIFPNSSGVSTRKPHKCCHDMRFESCKCVKIRLRPRLEPGIPLGSSPGPYLDYGDGGRKGEEGREGKGRRGEGDGEGSEGKNGPLSWLRLST